MGKHKMLSRSQKEKDQFKKGKVLARRNSLTLALLEGEMQVVNQELIRSLAACFLLLHRSLSKKGKVLTLTIDFLTGGDTRVKARYFLRWAVLIRPHKEKTRHPKNSTRVLAAEAGHSTKREGGQRECCKRELSGSPIPSPKYILPKGKLSPRKEGNSGRDFECDCAAEKGGPSGICAREGPRVSRLRLNTIGSTFRPRD